MRILFIHFAVLFTFCLCSNIPSSVLELNEKFVEVKNEGMWFIEFYAPWCAHCKRLHPVWDQVGHTLADTNLPIRVGKLDCTRFPSVPNSLGINGYPTLIFFRNGKRIDYRGSRERDALVSFAKRCAAPTIEKITRRQLDKVKLDSRTDPSFIFYGKPSGAEYEKFQEISNKMFSLVRFYSLSEDKENQEGFKTRICVLKDNAEFEFVGNVEELEHWVNRERWPGFVAASSANLAEIGASGKLVVLAVSNELEKYNTSSEIQKFHSLVESASKELRKDRKLWERFQFAWLDGSDLASQIQMTTIKAPHLFVFNYTTYEYYLTEDEPQKMTKNSILVFLKQLAESVDKGTVVAFGGRDLFTRIKRMVFEFYWNIAQMFATQPLLSSCLFGVPIAFLSIICYSICSADFSVDRDEFYPDDEDPLLDDEEESEKEDEEEYDENHEKAE
ncbi:unnamed protein product [Caenorhabditis angaria]|uniref:Thioredoxin domain-containing protein n=1 Tax=Caenorhabditis angaria TaxID=860376 RepID=A0A9P1MUS7_9PELO|nr:unnamed protein product [Caenorhabditis angaria]